MPYGLIMLYPFCPPQPKLIIALMTGLSNGETSFYR